MTKWLKKFFGAMGVPESLLGDVSDCNYTSARRNPSDSIQYYGDAAPCPDVVDIATDVGGLDCVDQMADVAVMVGAVVVVIDWYLF